MRFFLTVVFLVTFSTAHASWPYLPGPGFDESGGGCDVCTGGLVFSYYANSLTVGDTNYSPCGCVVAGGDSSGTIVGTASIAGTSPNKYVSIPSGANSVSFSSTNIFNQTEGSMLIEFEINTWSDNALLGGFSYSVDNRIVYIVRNTGDDIGLQRRDGGVNDPLEMLTGGAVSVDNKYHAIIRWSQTLPKARIELYNSSGTLVDSGEDTGSMTDIDTFPDNMFVGTPLGALVAKVYQFKVWSTYSGAAL